AACSASQRRVGRRTCRAEHSAEPRTRFFLRREHRVLAAVDVATTSSAARRAQCLRRRPPAPLRPVCDFELRGLGTERSVTLSSRRSLLSASGRMATRLRENREGLRILLWRAFPRAMLLTRYIHRFRQVPNLWRPRGFTEHLLVRMLFDRDPRLALFADKLTARAYAKARLGEEENL